MKKRLTKIIFVIDRSGSMETIASDMIGGFNEFIRKQKENNIGECIVTFNQFDNVFETVYKNIPIQDVKELDSKTYFPRNSTALYDAVGKTIKDVGVELESLNEDQRPEKVLVVILTDGFENSSKSYSQEEVRNMITHQQQKYNWDFIYIGANQDSWAVGGSIGISCTNTCNYVSTGQNASISMDSLWDNLSDKIYTYRSFSNVKVTFSTEEQEAQNDLIKSNS